LLEAGFLIPFYSSMSGWPKGKTAKEPIAFLGFFSFLVRFYAFTSSKMSERNEMIWVNLRPDVVDFPLQKI
jgi:hypothetical protein